MSRLTKKFNGEYYHKEAKTIMFNNETDYNVIQKLGKLEDILEKYNIDSVEELDKLLQTLKNYIVKSQTYNCENGTYSAEQLSIDIDEDDGEDFKIVKKILWEKGNKQ